MQFEGTDESQIDELARRAAEYLWWTCRQDVSSMGLTKEDLVLYLGGNEADADYLFNLFDINNDGFVLMEEVQQRFVLMYRYAQAFFVPSTSSNTRCCCVHCIEGASFFHLRLKRS
jgi:hypothetical protein